METVEKMARSDAVFDGRDFDALGAADKKRYLARSQAGFDVVMTELRQRHLKETMARFPKILARLAESEAADGD